MARLPGFGGKITPSFPSLQAWGPAEIPTPASVSGSQNVAPFLCFSNPPFSPFHLEPLFWNPIAS